MVGLPPLEFSGDPDCEHEWSNNGLRKNRWGGFKDASSKQLSNRGSLANDGVIQHGDTCTKCGAWRGSLGNEPSPEMFIAHLVLIFREIKRSLRDDGTLWLNFGDSSVGYKGKNYNHTGKRGTGEETHVPPAHDLGSPHTTGLREKNILGMPWRLAFALQADGWYLRSDIIWNKPNGMPESVSDRPTRNFEYIFLLSKQPRYFYDDVAIAENAVSSDPKHEHYRKNGKSDSRQKDNVSAGAKPGFGNGGLKQFKTKNRRSVWTITPQPYKGAHFAAFPPKLPRLCIQAGTSERGACPTCGAPWRRITSRADFGIAEEAYGKTSELGDQHRNSRLQRRLKAGRAAGADHDNPFPNKETLGWYPSCKCYEVPVLPKYPKKPKVITWEYKSEVELIDSQRAALCASVVGLDTVPCVVLDPFLGSGTTIAEALRLGRRGVGCELNEKYIALALKRIERSLTMAEAKRAGVKAPAPPLNELPLFEGLE